jgi:predicted nucleotidyltransferase
MSIPKSILQKYPEIMDWGVLVGYRGSIAHGLYVPQDDPNSIDDKDIISICIPPKEYYFGLKEFGSRGTKEITQNEWDIVVFEFKKFISLLVKGNPNVLSLLWLDKEFYLKITTAGQQLIEQRGLFVNKQVYHSFSGYAYGQLYRMNHHAFRGYMGDKRKKLVEKYGYDTKNASHLIRLLKMAIEFLIEGRLYVRRRDSQQLLEIKNGLWTLEQVKKESEKLFGMAQEAYIKSTLPNEPNKETINQLCVEILENTFLSR